MSHPLDGVTLKVRRAREQLDALYLSIVGFVKEKPYKTIREMYPEGRELRLYFRAQEHFPPLWSVRIGEIAHNLHSALDHLVWQLFILENNAPSLNTKLQFPVFVDPTGYKARSKNQIAGLSADACALIKSLQPFETGEYANSPLWHLYQLSVWDKHKDMAFTTAALPRNTRTVIGLDESEIAEILVVRPNTPLKNEALVAIYRLHPSAIPFEERIANVQVKFNYAINIVFDQPLAVKAQRVVGVLNECGARVGQIVDRVTAELFGLK